MAWDETPSGNPFGLAQGAPKGNQNAANPERTAQVHELRSQGKTRQAIADELGISRDAVAKQLTRYDGTNKRDNVTFECPNTPAPAAHRSRGNSEAYAKAKLARDRPDLLPAIGPGKQYKTARVAAIAAGLIKPPPPTVSLGNPKTVAARILAVWDREQVAELIAALQSQS